MGRAIGLLGVLIALAIGAYIYMQQAQSAGKEAGNPRATIDLVGVKMDLNNLAQAERRYQAREGHYATIDQLRSANDISMARDNRGPYTYSASASDTTFTITATYGGPANPDAPQSLSIDENMQIH
ncbi:MAG TPA: hypothetical protein VGR50_01805 [Terriglobales bacterium]|nr:hypothetical protein [Terriglobales bacterium]